ncbi:MAG: DUF2344 domain-containing protein [wastewater metagenome]|nr:DUF2344 domain-containing protein [Candidatus Loosdrechtia aerotolerans]
MLRIRIRFTKTGDIRFISHHDLMKVFERAVRRAHIPIEISKGFNPHPRLSIPLALSVGIIGKDEILELELQKPIPLEILHECLSRQLPKEIQILSGEVISDSTKNHIGDICYEVIFQDASLLKTVKVNTFLQQSSITVNRLKDGHHKLFDIRPSVKDIQIKSNKLIITLRMTPGGTAKPEEILHILGFTRGKEFFEIIRTKVNISSA